VVSIGDTPPLKGNHTHDPTIDEINTSIIPGDPTGFWPGGYPLPDSLNPNYAQANDLWMYSPRVDALRSTNSEDQWSNQGR
jgi:hypothetical protein